MKTKTIGALMVTFALAYVITETHYFGGNLIAQSVHEWLCDMTAYTLCAIGIYLYNGLYLGNAFIRYGYWASVSIILLVPVLNFWVK